MTEEAAYSVPEDGNEDVCGGCGSCNDGDNLICCDSCPAAFHAECAGYANIGEVPNGDWLCWACAKKAKRAFLHPKTALQPQVGDDVMVASEQSGTAFRRARVVSTTDVNLYVAFLLSQQDKVWINKKSKRLWHGTLDAQAWSAGQGSESFPNSRTLRPAGWARPVPAPLIRRRAARQAAAAVVGR
ncbi:hypothetical protein WJX72_002781 [[Myrmecia] bisecta]|uniref:PHD-type domain-containing protein n=1 Tax=[Myrmecia] bisecta TaxID=41462 RepID=A0AAW1QB55_9CHLO